MSWPSAPRDPARAAREGVTRRWQHRRRAESASAQSKPGRSLALILIAIVALTGGMFASGHTTPRLGIDLAGGTSITLAAKNEPGQERDQQDQHGHRGRHHGPPCQRSGCLRGRGADPGRAQHHRQHPQGHELRSRPGNRSAPPPSSTSARSSPPRSPAATPRQPHAERLQQRLPVRRQGHGDKEKATTSHHAPCLRQPLGRAPPPRAVRSPTP